MIGHTHVGTAALPLKLLVLASRGRSVVHAVSVVCSLKLCFSLIEQMRVVIVGQAGLVANRFELLEFGIDLAAGQAMRGLDKGVGRAFLGGERCACERWGSDRHAA